MELKVARVPSKVIERLQSFGYDAFLVGGSVRDLIMGNIPQDWDITTAAPPDKVIEIFEKTIPTGIQHGTVTVVIENTNIEVTTYRTESGYKDNRHPGNVEFVTEIESDLSRRDFTINAMAYNESAGLIDIFGGVSDIHNKIIRCVGVPSKRYEEDALRMLRAMRFAAKLGFDIQKETLQGIKRNAHLLKNISKQRIKHEFAVGLNSRYADKMGLLWQTGLIAFIHPSLVSLDYDKVFGLIPKMPSILPVRLAVLLEENEPFKAKEILREMEFDNHTMKLTAGILQALELSEMTEIKRFISKNGFEPTELAMYILKEKYGENYSPLNNILHIKKTMPPIRMAQLNINGDDLKGIGICDGLTIGRILNELLEKVWENPDFNTKSLLMEYVLKKIKIGE